MNALTPSEIMLYCAPGNGRMPLWAGGLVMGAGLNLENEQLPLMLSYDFNFYDFIYINMNGAEGNC